MGAPIRVAQQTEQDVPGAHPALREVERGDHPSLLHGQAKFLRRALHVARAGAQGIERGGELLRQRKEIDAEVTGDAVKVAFLAVRELVEKMNHLDPAMPAQLAEAKRAFEGLESEVVEFAKKIAGAEVSHGIQER